MKKLSKLKLSLIVPILSYIIFISTLYFNTSIASLFFFIMVLSTIIITIAAFSKEGIKNVKET